jgi:guanylate kinase
VGYRLCGMCLARLLLPGSHRYGTSLAAVAQVSAAGKHCVLDIDVQGAAQVRRLQKLRDALC